VAIRRVLIANRGEIAARVIRVCQEMGLGSVAVYSESDSDAPYLKEADLKVFIGASSAKESYLNQEKILAVAKKHQCDAIHPGYGFLSENAEFAERCEKMGLYWIGPKAKTISLMGDKARSKDWVRKAGGPLIEGYHGENQDPEFLKAEADRIEYPVLLKPSAGGGGKGMRVVSQPQDFKDALKSAKREAASSFGNDQIMVEKYVESPRHIEVQVFGDGKGNVVHLFERECSIQRRNQKIIEETPAVDLKDAKREEICEAAVSIAASVNYRNAGTVEFVYSNKDEKFYFLEMNTRLQVEHPITEEVVGVDLVRAQLQFAQDQKLPWKQSELSQRGHAIECRIYAEDPSQGFLPSSGELSTWLPPSGVGIRCDSGVEAASTVGVFYDPMLAKLICRGSDRKSALEKTQWALKHFYIAGISHNVEFLKAILENEAFERGEVDTHFIQKHLKDWKQKELEPSELSLVALALAESAEGSYSTYKSEAQDVATLPNPWRAWNSHHLSSGVRK
jgi:3-methylcrotonyl-CoA carboxylase alpha subunit